MREIKFRLWNPERNVITAGVNLNTLLLTTDNLFVREFNKSKMIWMQFTGLKDKNGKQIYEGDIVQLKWVGNTLDDVQYLGEVKWTKWCYHICAPKKHSIVLDTIIINSRNPIIIGNIYQNPELLK